MIVSFGNALKEISTWRLMTASVNPTTLGRYSDRVALYAHDGATLASAPLRGR